MAITRWDPFRELEDMTHRLNRILSPSWRGNDNLQMAAFDWMPVVDIKENTEAFLIHAELPGMKKEDVHIHLENGVLTLRGERRQEKDERDATTHRVERSYGAFIRSFTLPENVDDSQTLAELKDGVLTVKLMKTTAQKPKSRKIEIM